MYALPAASSSLIVHLFRPMAYEYDVGILAQQQSVYVPGAMIDKEGAGGKLAKGVRELQYSGKAEGKSGKIRHYLIGTLVRRHHHLLKPFTNHFYLAWFRLFVGDLSNDVSDDVLANAFNNTPPSRSPVH